MTQYLRDIFAKPVDRAIDGVIKADDDTGLRIELDEYVITDEIGQRIELFLEAYTNYHTANGVWISGFFGSGKSHLLKMLALLLENREVDGRRAADIFLEKEKIKDAPMIRGLLQKAVAIPSRSILFNIDQKADVISKTDVDALLAVFQKVFDDSCGFYGKQPHIAQMERDLHGRGQLDTFKAAFHTASGKPWERGREQALLEARNIATAFAAATGGDPADAKDILNQYRKDTRVSIEDFAATIKAWIDEQEPNFRLNFFVDEVGQYIADNVKLMTNLQTIAESLNTKCKGQAWIIVTAQQDMASVIGDMTQQQENDFSKIQARFSNRMPLNSADVAEVIQRRLLSKTEEGEAQLGNLYRREENNLKTLFDFTDGSIKLKNFRDRDEFVLSYPFPPYQYPLFQMAIQALSQHNAFEGKHSSVGERSMLGVFQEVAKKLKDQPVGGLATFDQMFEGIRTALKSSVQQSIHIAERDIEDVDPFAVRVLKALFLVKYVKEFKPSVRNISILLLSGFESDQTAQRRRIEEALAFLERNTLIQRNGEVYEFLTNEEKDVEAEIKALPVEQSEVSGALETMAFDAILRSRKIRHNTSGNEYQFTRRLDGHLIGKEHELAIHLFSPFSEDGDSPETIRTRTIANEELAVVMKPDQLFLRDMVLFKQTDKFVRQSRSGSPQPGRDRIIAEKGEQNSRRSKDLELRLRKLIGEARLFVRGDELDISGEDPQERVTKAFQTLVDKVHTNLPMLRGVIYTEADIMKSVQSGTSLFGENGEGLGEPEQEILNFLSSQARNGVKVSAKHLTDKFSTKPYGWPSHAVMCLTGTLVTKNKIEARIDGAVYEGVDLARALNNSQMAGNLLLTTQTEFTPAVLRNAKDFYRELFGSPPGGSDARTLGEDWKQAVDALEAKVDDLTRQVHDYPFMAALAPLQTRLKAMKGKPAAWYITEPIKQQDELLDARETILDKILSFMSGAQKDIYDDARKALSQQSENIADVDADAGRRLRAVMDDENCYRGSAIQNLKADLYDLKNRVDLAVIAERKAAGAALDEVVVKLGQLPEYVGLTPEQKQSIDVQIEAQRKGLDKTSLIPSLRDRGNQVRHRFLTTLLSTIAEMIREWPAPLRDPGTPPTPAPKSPSYVHARDLKVDIGKPYLTDEAEVTDYLAAMRKTLLSEIAAGKKVMI